MKKKRTTLLPKETPTHQQLKNGLHEVILVEGGGRAYINHASDPISLQAEIDRRADQKSRLSVDNIDARIERLKSHNIDGNVELSGYLLASLEALLRARLLSDAQSRGEAGAPVYTALRKNTFTPGHVQAAEKYEFLHRLTSECSPIRDSIDFSVRGTVPDNPNDNKIMAKQKMRGLEQILTADQKKSLYLHVIQKKNIGKSDRKPFKIILSALTVCGVYFGIM